MQNTCIIETISTSVSCFGKEFPFDHPKVYLQIDPSKGSIECPYCSKEFVLTNDENKTSI